MSKQVVRGVVSRKMGEKVEVVDVVIPDPGPREVVVDVIACGVCHTDLTYRDGGINDEFPFLLGHEAAGTVESVGERVTHVEPGDSILDRIARRQHQNRDVLTSHSQLRRDGKSILAWQHHIEHDDIEWRPVAPEQGQCQLAGFGNDDLVSIGLEIEPYAFGDVLLVFHDENAAHPACAPGTPAGKDVARGSSTVKVAPRPSPSLCAKTRPPCARAIVRTM